LPPSSGLKSKITRSQEEAGSKDSDSRLQLDYMTIHSERLTLHSHSCEVLKFNVSRIVIGHTDYTRAIQKVTSSELLAKQAMGKNHYMQKICTYLSHFSTQSPLELKHLSHRGISFYIPVSKKPATCEFNHILTPSINFSLLMKHCDLNQYFR
jgi:hypothetical protein